MELDKLNSQKQHNTLQYSNNQNELKQIKTAKAKTSSRNYYHTLIIISNSKIRIRL